MEAQIRGKKNEIDDFEEKQLWFYSEIYFEKFNVLKSFNFYNGRLKKNVTKYSCIFFCFRTFQAFFFMLRKRLASLSGGGGRPLAGISA